VTLASQAFMTGDEILFGQKCDKLKMTKCSASKQLPQRDFKPEREGVSTNEHEGAKG